jgi:hypothetical protein
MVLAAAIFPLGVRASWADEHAPDPRMLLNLDLFTQNSNGGQPGTNTSMLEQIQTLRAMGYLNNPNNPPAPQPAYIPPPPQPAYVVPPPPPPAGTEDDIRE